MSQIRPESLHVAPLDHLPGGATRNEIVAADYVQIESVENLDAGLEAQPGRVVVECHPGSVRALAANGHLVAVCPDDLGAEPGGALEAVVTKAIVDGARVIRSEHHTEVRRCMHMAAALLVERQGVAT